MAGVGCVCSIITVLLLIATTNAACDVQADGSMEPGCDMEFLLRMSGLIPANLRKLHPVQWAAIGYNRVVRSTRAGVVYDMPVMTLETTVHADDPGPLRGFQNKGHYHYSILRKEIKTQDRKDLIWNDEWKHVSDQDGTVHTERQIRNAWHYGQFTFPIANNFLADIYVYTANNPCFKGCSHDVSTVTLSYSSSLLHK